MRKSTSLFAGLMAFLSTLPLPLGLAALCFDGGFLISLLPGSLFVAAELLSTRLKGKTRGLLAVLFILCEALLCMYALPRAAGVWRFLPAVLYTVLLLILFDKRIERDQMLWRFGITGVCVYTVSQIVLALCAPASSLRMAQTPLSLSFLLFGAAAVFLLNRITAETAAGEKNTVPLGVVRRNTLLTLLFFMFILLLSALPQVSAFLSSVWELIKKAAAALYDLLSGLFSATESTGGGAAEAGETALSGMEGGETAPFWVAAEKAALVFALLLALILLAWLAVKGYHLAKALCRKLKDRLLRYLEAAGEGYTDEISDLRKEKEDSSAAKRKKRPSRRFFKEERGLSPEEKVRFRYAKLVYEHPEWSPANTARENLPEGASALYERVRYGEGKATEEEAENWRPLS